ncbi:MAG: hypothetical protein WBP41_12365, partial [Saprospiraceae bacterium]
MDNTTTLTIGNLVVSEVAINNTTGGGFDASNGSGASMNAVFSSISSTNGVNGIDLTNCAGTFTVNGGTITNPTGTGVLISGGSVTFSSSGVITDNSGFAVDVDNHDSNNVTFSGNITSTGTGIRVQNCGGGTKTFSGASKSLTTGTSSGVTLSSNTGATITISGGGLVITTTTGTGFNATGGATAVNVTGTGNTLTSTTGIAINISATNIGASNITFQSVNSTGTTTNPAIKLDNTGSAGSFIVSGNGGACAIGSLTCTGGSIQNKGTNDAVSNSLEGGIFLNSSKNPQFNLMNVSSNFDNGLIGTNLDGISISTCVFDNNGSAVKESGIRLGHETDNTRNGVTGIASITNTAVKASSEFNVAIFNSSGTLTSLNVSGLTSSDTKSRPLGADGMIIEIRNTAIATVTITGSTFANNFTQGIQAAANDNTTLTLVATGNTFTSNNEGIVANHGFGSTLNATIGGSTLALGNTFTGHPGASIVISQASTTTGNTTGTIQNNNVTSATDGSTVNHGIIVFVSGTNSHGSFKITNNTVTQHTFGH